MAYVIARVMGCSFLDLSLLNFKISSILQNYNVGFATKKTVLWPLIFSQPVALSPPLIPSQPNLTKVLTWLLLACAISVIET